MQLLLPDIDGLKKFIIKLIFVKLATTHSRIIRVYTDING
jgi:hypothetical protein